MKKSKLISILISLFFLSTVTEMIMQDLGHHFLFPRLPRDGTLSFVAILFLIYATSAFFLFLVQCVLWVPRRIWKKLYAWLKSLDRDVIIPERIVVAMKALWNLIAMGIILSPILGLWGIVILSALGISLTQWIPEMFCGFLIWCMLITFDDDEMFFNLNDTNQSSKEKSVVSK